MRTYLSDGFNFFSELKSKFFVLPHPSNFFSWFEMQPCTHSSSGISRPKKRDPKNVADPPMLPCKSETQKKMRSKAARSEEHTSELQSPDHLLCRLLLEKKKTNILSINAQ